MTPKPPPRLIDFPRIDRHRAYHVWYQLCDKVRERGLDTVTLPTGKLHKETVRNLRRMRLIRPLLPTSQQAYLVPVVWAREDFAFPYAYRHPVIPICNDCWEPQFPKWLRMLQRLRVPTAFFTARIAGEYFASRIPGLDWHWLPEAIEPATCDPSTPLAERTVGLVEFGRTLPVIRERTAKMFDERGYVYRGAANDQWVTRSQPELCALLGNARLAACFPKTMTHLTGPYAPGRVETLTFRYLEVIASGCLPYGRGPAELKDLFGFNPVIEADLSDPAAQIDDLMQNIEAYQPLADRSLKRLHETATWDVRVSELFECLRVRGYDVPADTALCTPGPSGSPPQRWE